MGESEREAKRTREPRRNFERNRGGIAEEKNKKRHGRERVREGRLGERT